MTTNEIKKALYKQKPKAEMVARAGIGEEAIHWYATTLEGGTIVTFNVPRKEMGETMFEPVIDAQLLIRWLQDGYDFVENEDGTISTEVYLDDERPNGVFPSEDDDYLK